MAAAAAAAAAAGETSLQTSFLAEGGGHRSAGWLAGLDQMLPTEWKGSKPRPLETAPLASFPAATPCWRELFQGDGCCCCCCCGAAAIGGGWGAWP